MTEKQMIENTSNHQIIQLLPQTYKKNIKNKYLNRINSNTFFFQKLSEERHLNNYLII